MELIDNVSKILKQDLQGEIKPGSRIAIAASCSSIYAFQELKEQLKGIKVLRFIFTSSSFTMERNDTQKREFYIPRINRERNIYGSEFEIKLRNELSQKAIAKECSKELGKRSASKSRATSIVFSTDFKAHCSTTTSKVLMILN